MIATNDEWALSARLDATISLKAKPESMPPSEPDPADARRQALKS